MAAHHATIEQPNAQEGPGIRKLFDRLAPDEVAPRIGQGNGPGQAGLVGGDQFVHILTVQVHAGFKAKGVARAEAARLDALGDQVMEKGGDVTRRQGDLKAILTGVPGARHHDVTDTRRAKRLERL